MKIAVYPGTFDPMTNGHVDLIHRAAQLFDRVIVAVAASARKTPCIEVSERVMLCEKVVQPFHNVDVKVLSGLLVEFAKRTDAQCIVRGLRAVSDFDYEFQLAGMNHKMAPDIETLFLPANPEYTYISGTMVREIISLGKDVSQFVPPAVAEYLRENQCP